jgi:hypothetical protein
MKVKFNTLDNFYYNKKFDLSKKESLILIENDSKKGTNEIEDKERKSNLKINVKKIILKKYI